MNWGEVKTVALAVTITVATLVGGALFIMFSFQSFNIMVQPDIIVHVDGLEVYSGNAAAVSISSSGSTTQVDIGSGFLYLMPGKKYVSNFVHVENLEDYQDSN